MALRVPRRAQHDHAAVAEHILVKGERFEIVAKLRQVDVLVSQGQNMVDAIRQIGVSEVTYYRWRQEFGGLKTEQVKRGASSSRCSAARLWLTVADKNLL